MIFCTSCGKKLNDGASFCDGCGTRALGVRPTPPESLTGGVKSGSDEVKTNVYQSQGDEFSTLVNASAPPVAIGSQVGRVLGGRYQLDDCIGAGGMGEIYKARRLHIGDTVAVKVLRPDVVENDKSRQRFYREARAAAMLHHPNAVVIHDFGEDADGTTYIVMELLIGRSLRQLLIDQGAITSARAFSIMRQACAAIDAGHRNGIIHRDIKPDNIILVNSHDGTDLVKILDFGIAKVRDSAIDTHSLEQRLTNFGTIIGTPHYMSPEQCQGEEADARSDIYSIGVVLYELLTGVAPFVAKTPTGIAIKHVTEPPRPLREINPNISAAVEKVVLHALEKSPNSRPQTALELSRELEAAINIEPETARLTGESEAAQLIPEEPATPIPQANESPAEPASYDTVVNPAQTDNLGSSSTGTMAPPSTSEQKIGATEANLKLDKGTEILPSSSDTGKVAEPATGRIEASTMPIGSLVQAPPEEPPVKAEPPKPIEKPAVRPTPEKIQKADKPQEKETRTPEPVKSFTTAPSMPAPGRRSNMPLLAGIGAVVLIVAAIGIWRLMSSGGQAPAETDAASVATSPAAGDAQPSAEPTSAYPQVEAPEGMVYVLGGVIRIGRDDGDKNEIPAHVETVKPFFIDRTEVTNAEYLRFIEATGYAAPPSWNGSSFPEGADAFPVTDVTWEDATAYATWAGKRLPSEVEWEFAARGPEGRLYPWGDKFRPDAANISSRAGEKRQLSPVGQYAGGASVFGVVDLVGNAWEWTSTDFAAYPGGRVDARPGYSNLKVIRGGSYESTPQYATATYRVGWPASRRNWPNPSQASYGQTGFRCARDAGNE